MVYMYTTYWTFVAFPFFDHISPANSLSTALRSIRIGTRPSSLAKIQANAVADALRKVLSTNQDGASFDISILDILATGDEIPAKRSDVPLAVQLVDFTGTLDEALLAKEIDIAVHSLKDIPPSPRWVSGIEIAACLERENPGDVLVSPLRGNQNGNGNRNGNQNDARNESQGGRDGFKSIQSLPQGARVGTSSVRRQAQLLHLRKDLELINLRGSVGARITSLEEGTVDVLILAKAGLNRLLLKEKKEYRGGESSFQIICTSMRSHN